MAIGTPEDDTENKGVDTQHDEWSQEGPEDAKESPSVAFLNLPAGKLNDEIPVVEKIPKDSPRDQEISYRWLSQGRVRG